MRDITFHCFAENVLIKEVQGSMKATVICVIIRSEYQIFNGKIVSSFKRRAPFLVTNVQNVTLARLDDAWNRALGSTIEH